MTLKQKINKLTEIRNTLVYRCRFGTAEEGELEYVDKRVKAILELTPAHMLEDIEVIVDETLATMKEFT